MPRRQQPRQEGVFCFLNLGDCFVGAELRSFLGNWRDEDINQGQDDRKPDEVNEPGDRRGSSTGGGAGVGLMQRLTTRSSRKGVVRVPRTDPVVGRAKNAASIRAYIVRLR